MDLNLEKKSIYQDPIFIRYLVGFSSSALASWGLVFILGISVVEEQLTATQLGLALGLRTVGFLLGVLAGGVLADRFACRKVIFISSSIALFGIVLIVFGLSAATLLVYGGCLITGMGQGAVRPAFQAYTPVIVDIENLPAANAAFSLAIRMAILVGPAAISLIVLNFSTVTAYYALIIVWLICAFITPWSDKDKRANKSNVSQDSPSQKVIEQSRVSIRQATSSVITDWIEGLNEAKKHPWFFYTLAAITLTIALGYSSTQILLPLVAKQSGSLVLLTKAITAMTVGAIICALLLNKFKPPTPQGWFALFGLSLYGFAPLSLLFQRHSGYRCWVIL